MASMTSCPCGWTIISPQGENDVLKHMKTHLSDTHPGTAMKDEEIMKTIRSI
jgi:predicted small metal-binding protein